MRKRKFSLVLLAVFLAGGLLTALDAEEKEKSEAAVKELGNISIDTIKKEIRLKCKLALEEGILEWMLVDERGQTYESVFKIIGNKPSELHFALVLLGFEPLAFNDFMGLIKDKDAVKILKEKKSLLKMEILYKDKPLPFEKLLRNREDVKPEPLYWVFTGSFFTGKNAYAADLSLIYMSIWPDMSPVINLLSGAGNPYRGNQGYELAAEHGLAVDEDIVLVIKGAE